MKDYKRKIKEYLDREIEVINSLNLETISTIMNIIESAQKESKTIFICGNGGSSATASHYCCDFNKGVSGTSNNNTNFICLSDNVPTMTAIANDLSYDEVFAFQLRNRMKPGDILFVISGSGNSKNIVRAMEVAKSKGNFIIGLCGYNGGKVLEMSDVCLNTNINNMQITEDIHMILDHVMMYILAGY